MSLSLASRVLLGLVFLCSAFSTGLEAQPLQKSAVNVDAGNTKQTGETFGYRLTYSCNNTLTDCTGAEVIDLLPAEVEFLSTVPASAGGDVAAVEVTPNYMGSGRTRVRFDMVDPLTAGNSGDLIINVRFPRGSTPDGTVATNTADGINLETTPGTVTTPPVNVTAVASTQVNLTKTVQGQALLDLPTVYRLRINVPNDPGALDISNISVTDTLPPGVVFNSASPAADCEPGCQGTVAPALVWTGPFSVNAGNNLDFFVTVTFPTPTFMDGDMATNTFTANGTPLGQPPGNLGVGDVTHPVNVFTPDPDNDLAKRLSGPNPPTYNQEFSYTLDPRNTGNVDLDNFVIIDNIPPQFLVDRVGTGAFNNAPTTTTVDYETNLNPFANLGSSPGNVFATLNMPVLGAGEYVTRLRWSFGTAPVGMIATNSNNRPRIWGQIINPDHLGNPVNIGDTISNCADLTSAYDPGGANTPVNDLNQCRDLVLSGPFVQLNPDKVRLTGGGPFNPGQTLQWRLRLRSSANSSDPLPLEELIAADLLPVDLIYTAASWTFDDLGTGLPAPQNFEEIANYAGTGRTLLRWTWNAASGDLAPGQEIRIEYDSTIRNGAAAGDIDNTLYLNHDDPGLGQRCGTPSAVDILDLDGDSDTAESHCIETASAEVVGIAQLVSSKQLAGNCDGGFGASSSGTLIGGSIEYLLTVQNVGTVAMEDFVLIDILPFLGDTGVLDTNPRLSDWTPLLTAPITPPPGTAIFYSTSGNPCRPEVGGITTGCDAPNWTTVAPDPISTVRSFKIEFGDRVVNPGDSLQFEFQLTTPAEASLGGTAFNSFAYLGQRSDGLGSLSAEPNKVGVGIGPCPAAELGDYVWVDTDGDGIQDDGDTGLNNVFVELFTPGADGVPRTFDDVRVATALTSDDVMGNPGWYLFPGLAPGDYYVRFDPPPTYAVTVGNAGGDDALDSDADPVTACTPLVNLVTDESDLTVDMGLLPPQPAAIGNYVWFDRDNDGTQDESPYFGVNGVAVRLYIDDGDGVPEPGGDDGAAVATTATDDDVYGRPGYYLFDLLTPNIPYFVEFVLPASATGFTSQDTGGDDTIDSDADTGTGVTQVVTPNPGDRILTLDAGLVAPTGDLVLGDQVWCDDDNDGVFEPENGELGVDGVVLRLYIDVNADGEPTLDEYLGTTQTFTSGGFAGRYRFDLLDSGDYIVVVDLDNFSGSGELSGKVTSTGNDPAPDPDDDVNGDDNGTDIGAVLASQAVTLEDNNEPTTDDGDNDTNLTVDFGFTDAAVTVPEYDYGDAPDVISGTGPSDYQTTALDSGAFHLQGQVNSPYLGDCVDADDGVTQGVSATGDDSSAFGLLTGTCAVPGDDEDGVIFNGQLLAGSPASIDVTAAAGTGDCVLNAWIDWDRDGVFGGNANEILATDLTVPSGNTINLAPTVPVGTVPGTIYSRFRCNSTGGLTPTGPAADGEVEDHRTVVIGTDFGDAPDSYGTTLPTGAVHQVSSVMPLYMGNCVDTESDGQDSPGADGDDLNVGGSTVGLCTGDDEDGVTFPSPLVACGVAPVTVTVNMAGVLDAWIDFNNNNTFEVGEKVFNGTALTLGTNNLMVSVPCSVGNGTTYTRFRFSSTGIADPTGPASDGEVEDHVVDLRSLDLGDAPDTYGTLLPTGPSHTIDAGTTLYLGSCVDTEVNGQPTLGATGDDVGPGIVTVGACTGGDDEDGVVFAGTLLACSTDNVVVTAGSAGMLDAWIDFDGSGTFEPGEKIADGTAVAAGANNIGFTVPCAAALGTSYSRFRLSSAGIANPTGPAADGEIEDHVVTLAALDLGDAPDTYGTLLPTGAQHVVSAGTGLYLGACVDTDADGQPNAGADGDDVNPGLATAGTCVGNDDEDGVTLPLLVACDSVTVTVNAASAGVLDAWIDFNGSGIFEAGEKVFDSQGVSAGSTDLGVNVPCDAVPGTSYARFRLSSSGITDPIGQAPDGEVEDYVVTVAGVDLGDAPDTYGTLLPTGPRHGVAVGTSLFLGACVDTEADGQPTAGADGDDLGAGIGTVGTCAAANDDEDGVSFESPLIACQTADLTVTAAAGGLLDGWIDFGGDGTFEVGDQVFDNQTLVVGANSLQVNVPCDAVAGDTHSRFRLSSSGVVDPTGSAIDGEVEDYLVNLRETDLGDAPDSYGTTVGADGPRHGIDAGFHLGADVDSEADGQPSSDALGDGADENGVTFPGGPGVGTACAMETLTVNVSADGVLDAWIDFDADGTFDDPRDRVANNTAVTTGSQPLAYTVPCDVSSAMTYARFRFSSTGAGTPTGPAVDGEIEDYAFTVRGLDYGDAPDPTYPTLLASDGARHVVLPVDNPTLGTPADTETDGQPSANHNGDDTDGSDDEDGVVFPAILIPGTDGTVELTVGSTGGSVNAWIDFNGDGDWNDPGEQIATDEPAAADTTVKVTFPVPVGSPEGTACVRVRISSETGLTPTGQAVDGEVEDHLAPVGVEEPSIGVNKMLIDLVEAGSSTVYDATFEIGLENLGNVPLSDVNVIADMSVAFADAAGFDIVSVVSMDFTPNPAYDGVNDIQMLDVGQTLGVGESGTLQVVVRIDSGGNPGPDYCSALGVGTSPEGEPVDDESEDGDDPDPDDNGDPEDNDTPTPVDLPVLVLDIPAVDTVGLVLLSLLLASAAMVGLRRRRS